jgi:tetratricopeptide (TPR) repeat protein
MKKRVPSLLLPLILTGAALAQSAPATPSDSAAPAATQSTPQAPDKAQAYYHYSVGHIYEELASMYGRLELANQAAEEYRQAIQNDPSSDFLNSALAELYAKTGRIGDAVNEAQDILKRDQNNIEAHRLLGRIYLRSLGDMQAGTQSSDVLQHAIEQYQAIVKLAPDSVEDHLLLGRLYRMNNDVPKAEAEFKTGVKLQPYSEEAVTTLAYLYNEQGDSAKAADILATIPDADRTARLYSALGLTYEQQKDYKKAIDAYRKAVELDEDNLDALRGLAQNLMNDGQNDAAIEQYRNVVKADPQDAQTYLRIAELYRRSGKFDLAMDSLKKAQSYSQDSVEVPYSMAVIYQAQGRYDDAIQLLQGLVKKNEKADGNYAPGERNNRSLFLQRLGNLYRETGKYKLATDTFRQMLTLGDDSVPRGYQELLDTYREARMWQQATDVAREAVEKVPADRNLKMALAAQLADTGQSDTALNDLKSLLKGNADDREVYISLAQVTLRLKRFKESEEYISKAANLSDKQDEKEFVYFVWGSIYERQKKYDEAEQMFKKVLQTDKQSAQTLNYLGYMLADRGVRLPEALGYIKKAVELEPQNYAYLDSLGWAYFKMGDYDLAEANLRHASERTNSDPTVHDHLGELYAKTGRLKLAATHWERAIQEWNRSVPAEVDQADFQRVTRKLESAKVKLAKQQQANRAEATKQ